MENPSFQAFDSYAPVRIYRRNLPHWRQDNATYFVTFRLADSIPRQVLLGWQEEDRIWLKANGILGDLSIPRWRSAYESLPEKRKAEFERRHGRRMHIELDRSLGSCILRDEPARREVVNALMHFDGKRVWIGDFVVMPNHVHALLKPLPGMRLEQILASVKGFSSTRLSAAGVKSGRLWQRENYDRVVRDRGELRAWRRYIASNPVKAGIGGGKFAYHRCGWLDP